ncbi:MAG: hypothetical protein IJ190_05810 [Prevotella sp.]|nr:hypothetical protein [Prevotella sp.]
MEPKRIKCPKCGGVLEVGNPKNEALRIVTCPNKGCGVRLRVAFDTGKTELAERKDRNGVIGSLCYHDTFYPLQLGKNTVGRKSSKSEATIQIDTDDLSMSRMHAEITVVKLTNGRVKVVLGDARSQEKAQQHPIEMEDEPMDWIDRVVLCHGDMLTMGRTVIRYVQE